MYEQITSNKRKTWGLMFLFSLLIIALGWAFGELMGQGFGVIGIIIAAVIALLMTWQGYYHSDKIVLGISKARAVEKVDYPHLYHSVEGLAIAAGIPCPRCYVINDSAPNAFATGRNPEKGVICVTTGLLDKLNRQELEGVIAHEMSHIKNYDTRLMTVTVVLVGLVALLSDWMMRSMFYGGGRRRSRGSSKGGGAQGIIILIAILLAILAPIIAQMIRLAISRKREFLADADAALMTRYPPGLANALRKISGDTEPLEAANKATAHLYIVNPLLEHTNKLNSMFSTHPPINERIAALEEM
jgi:heat shock protein HtpX